MGSSLAQSASSRLGVIFFLTFIGILTYLSLELSLQYYTRADLLGPVSEFPEFFVPLGFSLGVLIFLASNDSNDSERLKFVSYTATILLIIYLLLLPTVIERNYITDYSDAWAHMLRAVYVFQTGRSNVTADSYFDIQPGFFYATAIFMLVTGVTPSFLTKWFPFFFVIIAYVPALLFLGKSVFKNRILPLYICLSLLIMWPGRYHFSAQVYSLPLLVIVIGLILRNIYNLSLSSGGSVLTVVIFSAIIVVHQATSLATLAVLIATSVWLLVTKAKRFCLRSILSITVIFIGLWFGYLSWLTIRTFHDFLLTLIGVIDSLLTVGYLPFVSQAVTSQDPSYQQILIAKVLYTGGIYFASSLLLAYAWVRRHAKSGLILLMIVTISAIIYVLGFPLGGRGFAERAVIFSSFLAAIGLTRGFLDMPRRRFHSLLKVLFLVSLTLAGSGLFNSGRNHQSTTQSDYASVVFARNQGLYYADMSDSSRVNYTDVAYGAPRTQALTYTLGLSMFRSYFEGNSSNWEQAADRNLRLQKIYSNGFSAVYLVS